MEFLNNLAGNVVESVSKFGRGLSSKASEPFRVAGRPLQRYVDPRRLYQDPRRILDPTGVRGGILWGKAVNVVGDKAGMPKKEQGFLEGFLTTPGPLHWKLLAGMIGSDLNNPVGGAIYNEDGTLTENAKAAQQVALAQGKPDPFGYRKEEFIDYRGVPVDPLFIGPNPPDTRVEIPVPVSDSVPSPVPVKTQLETPRETPAPVVVQETPKPQNALAQKFLEDQMIGNEMANTGELQDLLMRSGAVGGISEKDLDTWTRSNSALAYRLAEKEGLLSGS
jgi:hypothetical protein